MTEKRPNCDAIAVFALESSRNELIRRALTDSQDAELVCASTISELSVLIGSNPPRCLILDLNVPIESDARQGVELIRGAHCPVAVFVETDDPVLMKNAIDAGAAAYVYQGLNAGRVRLVAEMAVRRFDAMSRLQDEVERARSALRNRKQIDRAKNLLMTTRAMSEPDAYALLRKTAMDQNCTIGEVADSLMISAALLK